MQAMEEGGGNKRRVGSAGEERERLQLPRNDKIDNKRMSKRETPKWLPHATANKPNQPTTEYHGTARRMEHGQERIQTISDSQRKFAAQYSLSATERGTGRAADVRIQGGSRWASKPGRPPKNPEESPVGSRWAAKPQPQESSFGMHMPVSRNATGAFAGGVQGHYGANRLGSHKEDRLRNEQAGGIRSDRAGVRDGAAVGRGGGALGAGGGSGGSGRGDGGQHRGKTSAGRAGAGLVKGPWTKEEDRKIIDCITQNITKWSEIAERVEGRVGKQCRERWFNHLDPSLKKCSWTPAEDEILVQGQGRFGNSWTKIAKLLPGRSENAVKNRWNSAARKKGKTDPRSSISDLSKMTVGVSAGGGVNADYMGGYQEMIPERVAVGQMPYLMAPHFSTARQIKPQSALSAGWPASSGDVHGHMRPTAHGGMPLSMVQACPPQQRPDQQSAGHDTSRTMGTEDFPEHGYGQVGAGQHLYGQSQMSQAGVLMTQRMPHGVGNHTRHPPAPLSQPRAVASLGSQAGVTNRAGPGADVSAKREMTASMLPSAPESHALPDAKGESLFSHEDDLSLSTTLFNLSLEQNSLGGFPGDFSRGADDSRADLEGLGASFNRSAAIQSRGSHSDPRGPAAGLSLGTDWGSGGGSAPYGDRALNGHMPSTGLPPEQQRQTPVEEAYRRPRLDFNASVSELLLSPTTQLPTGVSPTLFNKVARM